jgi:ribonuclease P/MRP protein subunit RPP1
MNEKLFNAACTTLEVDVISLDLSAKLPFPLKHTTLQAAAQRGVRLELTYGALLGAPSVLPQFISNVQNITRIGKGKGLFLASGLPMSHLSKFRSPADVANLYVSFLLFSQSVSVCCMAY